ncbi:MAG TPA: MarR family transcriptional regulator [Ktedonobacterales bacterium]
MAQTSEERQQELERLNTSQLLRRPYEAYIARLFEQLAQAGYRDVHPAHAIVFQHLPAAGARVTELAEQTQLTKQYLGRLVAELEALGYLERAPDPADGRAKLVRLSQSGWEITRAAEGIIANIETVWAQRIGEEGRMELRRHLIDLITAL